MQNSIENCSKEIVANEFCTKCMKMEGENYNIPYVLSEDRKKCSEPIMNEYAHCNSIALDEDLTSYCYTCEENYYPMKIQFNNRNCFDPDFWIFDPENNSVQLQDCEVFDSDNGECIRCQNGMFVRNGVCVSSCEVGEALFRREVTVDQAKNRIYYRRENFCDTSSVTNCELYDISVRSKNHSYSGETYYGCVKCSSGYLPIIDLATTVPGQAHNYSEASNKNGVNNRYPFISECVEESVVNANKIEAGASFDNCRYYIKSQGNKYGCFSCDLGNSGEIFMTDSTYYIKTCSSMTGCNSDTWYTGLGSYDNQLDLNNQHIYPLDLYLSCHECSDTT